MKEKTGVVFSIAADNAPVAGCTVSKQIHGGENSITYFSLAKNTDISSEIHPYAMLLIMASGSLEVYGESKISKRLSKDECILLQPDALAGMRTDGGAVYTQITFRRNDIMNEAIKAGEVFKLANLVPYQEGTIVNMDVAHNDKMKFAVMAFDKGTGLSEHAAPGEAIVFALDGEGVIGYECTEHKIKAGENFHFAKGGLHSVKATEKFKMALLLTLE